MDAIAVDRLDHDLAMPVAYFTTQALEFIADGQAEDASKFMIEFCRCIREDSYLSEVGAEAKGDRHADHA
ncbi:hypothetical protein QO034_23230 [Sedimentitalea sp. JM2-8]|uniref:Uncharacterized protein n=2 Tax=Sedimentitalea xiamensis TaxID=3050037 RepID=A0ABT7FLB7_9RHOB|nr:hypothetical protein [Sedimentitalea xiamensis]